MQEEFLDQSIMLAKMMQDNFSDGLKRNNRKVKQAGFIVLHQTFMPSVLIETGFLTNKSEGMYLNSKKGQSEMGNAIAEAIVKYKNSISVSSSVTAVSEPVKAANTKKEPIPVQETPEKEIVELKKETVPVIVPKEEKSVPKELPGKEDVAVNKELNVPQEVINKPEEIAEKPKEVVKKDLPTEEATKVAEKVAEEIKEKPAVKEPVIKKPVVVASTEEKKEVVPEKKKEVIPEKKTAIPSKKASSVLFKVQILASSKNLPLVPTNFNGLNKLSKEPYKNLFRYMYGNTNSYKDAKLLKSNADLKGFTTSYIVAYKDGKRISVQEALKYTSD
jgi:N-acetylmuramoyl-L-alanine amidase